MFVLENKENKMYFYFLNQCLENLNDLKKELLGLIPKPLPIIDVMNNLPQSQQLEIRSKPFGIFLLILPR